jgi:GNAT superfamily N-acetyltransferase
MAMSVLTPILPREGEPLVLPTGYRTTIRRITAQSRPLIVAAMSRLSLESSRRRFLTPRVQLSDRELDYLTTPDGVRHVALGVCGRAPDGSPEGIAVGRFVRTDDDPRVAEIALTVIDPFQRMGIGKALLARLVAAAIVRGIERLRAYIVPDNAAVLALLRKYAPSVRYAYDGELFTADIPLGDYRVAIPAAA